MDAQSLLAALLLGAVEGLTEFLPVSSTGHLIILSSVLGLTEEKDKAFSIVIQLGAILAVVWEYRERFARVALGLRTDPVQQRFVANLAVAFVPAAVLGLAFHARIKALLFNPVSVAAALIVGAILILAVERWYRARGAPRIATVDDMTWKDALKVGLAQCFSLIPGTSRSAATIMGGMVFGLSREAATQFSFFLAVPIMVAATGHQVVKYRDLFTPSDWAALAAGFVAAFLAALLAVRTVIRYVARHDYRPFAWYRIGLGLVVLAYFS
ncbi:MAG TPA: undecaprenyl-diphosphate phosphatase [Usitatibacter sp.]|nr:undecaprenyl-diphosphate phosphatase [Usitatibacter sp.]